MQKHANNVKIVMDTVVTAEHSEGKGEAERKTPYAANSVGAKLVLF